LKQRQSSPALSGLLAVLHHAGKRWPITRFIASHFDHKLMIDLVAVYDESSAHFKTHQLRSSCRARAPRNAYIVFLHLNMNDSCDLFCRQPPRRRYRRPCGRIKDR
jgi:hypothetical protein